MATAHIQIQNINQGGIADSDYLGAINSVSEIVGLNIHDEAGVIKLNQKTTRVNDTDSAVDALCEAIVPSSNGATYYFSATSGKVWKEAANGTWTLAVTNNPAAGGAGSLSAYEYQGYIYYAMESRLGRMRISDDTFTVNWATFTNTDAAYHPMFEVNQVLYIGDAHFVAQVDVATFSANALDLKTPLRISALGKFNTDLLIGTYVTSDIVGTEILRWNTWSDSYSVSDEIPEVGVNAFLPTDNRVTVSCGTKGNLYVFNGSQLDEFKQIKGTWGNSTNKAIVKANATMNFHGLPLFGLSKIEGDGVKLGIYSFGRTNANYPFVLSLEYPISVGNLYGVKIGAIAGKGDSFRVSWYDTTTDTYGIDYLDLTAKFASGYVTTRVSLYDRIVTSTYGVMSAAYRLLPDNTSVKFFENRNHAGFVEKTDTQIDTERLLVSTRTDAGEANTFQAKFEIRGNANNSPEIELFDIPVI
jgi:hypothetical protein